MWPKQRFISCNSENSVQNVIFTGIYVYSMKTMFCTRVFAELQYYKALFRPHIVKARILTLIFMFSTLAKLLESVQKYVINRSFQWNSLIFSKFSSNDRIWTFVHCNGPSSCLSVKTLKITNGWSFHWANNVYNTEFSVENTFRTSFCHRNTRIFCENDVLHTIFTITAYKAFLGHI